MFVCSYLQELEQKIDELELELNSARKTVSELTHAAQAQKLLERANLELDQLRTRLRVRRLAIALKLFILLFLVSDRFPNIHISFRRKS